MNRIFQVLLILSVTQAAWAYRLVSQPEDAYELDFVNVDFPGRTTGSLAFKRCGNCQTQSLRVTDDTQYLLDQNPVSYATFYEFVARIRATRNAPESAGVYVFYEIETGHVNRIKLKASLVN